MNRSHPDLDESFIEEQRRRLEELHRQATATQGRASRDERQLGREWEEPRDAGDQGTAIAQQDRDDSVERVEAVRLAEIERALEKVETGTYGLSDESGEPIPRERLQAKPEALRTVEEEEEAAARARG